MPHWGHSMVTLPMTLDVNKIRRDFPILSQHINGKPLVYFDNAATTQKPQVMIDALCSYYSEINANIHRGVHTLSQRATAAYESTRDTIANLYNCKTTEIIFTKNDTESLNLVAYTLGGVVLDKDSNIVITDAEHHSNIVPWQILSQKIGFEIRFLEFDEQGFIKVDQLAEKIDGKTKILSFTWASNTFGVVNPVQKIIAEAKKNNADVIVILDGAQALPHLKFDFGKLGADFVAFSAHKLCGPTGVGVLIGKEDLLNKMPPFLGGGDMIKDVNWDQTQYNDLPYKFEAGTPNIADIVAFRQSLEYLDAIGFDAIYQQEQELADYLLTKLSELDFVEIYGPKRLIPEKIALVSFNLKGVHAHDVGTMLDEDGIAVRTGHHCTQLIMRKLGVPATVRASLYLYNTKEEIDVMISSLKNINQTFA
jgi:cysteine desulfurase / selenocysteine lyase